MLPPAVQGSPYSFHMFQNPWKANVAAYTTYEIPYAVDTHCTFSRSKVLVLLHLRDEPETLHTARQLGTYRRRSATKARQLGNAH